MGLGWDGMGWDGWMDLRVGGGIEHLTVLIIYGVGMLVSLTNIPTPYYLPEVVMVGGRAVI